MGRLEHVNKPLGTSVNTDMCRMGAILLSGGQGLPHQRTVSFGGPWAEGQPAGETTCL